MREERLVVITAAMDAASVVPARATGGQRSINLFLLLQLLEDFRAAPPAHSVMLVAVNARTQRYAGDRALAWHLLGDEKRVEARFTDLLMASKAGLQALRAEVVIDTSDMTPEEAVRTVLMHLEREGYVSSEDG